MPGSRALEAQLADLFAEAVGRPIGIDENFFDAGLSAFAVMDLLLRMTADLGLSLSVNDSLALATIREVARFLASTSGPETFLVPPGGPEPRTDRPPATSPKNLLISSILNAVARRLESVSEEQLTQLDIEQLAERVAALVPTPHPFVRVGPFYPTSGVTKWLGVSRQALDQRVKARKLLGCPTADGGPRVYPVWQFTADGHTIPSLAEVLDTLHAGIDDPWSWATWLATAVPGRLDGKPAYQWLASGRDPEPVLTEARRTASRLAH